MISPVMALTCNWTSERGLQLLDLARIASDDLGRLTGSTTATIFEAAPGDGCFWIEDAGMVAALLVWRPWDRCLWIGEAWVMPNYRGLGLYSRLFRHACRYASASKYLTIGCGINPMNARSLAVHQRLGMGSVMLEMRV